MTNIWGSHGGDCGDYILEYKDAQLDKNLPMYRRNALLHLYSIWRRQVPSKHHQTPIRLYDVTSQKTTILMSGPSFSMGTSFMKPVGLYDVSNFSYRLS
jgi:hypothetical protein